MSWVSLGVSALTVGGTAPGLWASRRSGPGAGSRHTGTPEPGTARGGHPVWWWLGCTALIYLNQVLFTVYVLRVHHGDPSFIARDLPPGWFALDHGAVLRRLAEGWPAPTSLAPSVLRVQAFLELPFVVFGYLAVCRWLGPDPYRRALRLLPTAAAVDTATFCLIEASLPNPYTGQDIVIRLASAIALVLVGRRFSAGSARPDPTPLGLGCAAVSTVAFGGLVLVVYDTALLYNLGHLRTTLPTIAAAAVVLAGARLFAARSVTAPPGPAQRGRGYPRLGVVGDAFGWFLVLFFVPALPIRYGLGFGIPALSLIAGLLPAAAAGVAALRAAGGLARSGWVVLAVAIGVVLAAVLYLGYPSSAGYPEARLLAAVGAGLAGVIGTAAAADLRDRSSGARPGALDRSSGTP